MCSTSIGSGRNEKTQLRKKGKGCQAHLSHVIVVRETGNKISVVVTFIIWPQPFAKGSVQLINSHFGPCEYREARQYKAPVKAAINNTIHSVRCGLLMTVLYPCWTGSVTRLTIPSPFLVFSDPKPTTVRPTRRSGYWERASYKGAHTGQHMSWSADQLVSISLPTHLPTAIPAFVCFSRNGIF